MGVSVRLRGIVTKRGDAIIQLLFPGGLHVNIIPRPDETIGEARRNAEVFCWAIRDDSEVR